jgi:hypothetical protein
VIVCGLRSGSESVPALLLFVYICIAAGDPIVKKGRVGIPLTGLILPHFCNCPKPGPEFPT